MGAVLQRNGCRGSSRSLPTVLPSPGAPHHPGGGSAPVGSAPSAVHQVNSKYVRK